MNTLIILSAALLLDALLGEPDWLWGRLQHPARIMGAAIDWFDDRLNAGTFQRAKGAMTVSVLVMGALLLGWIIHLVPDFGVLEVLVVAILVGHRSLGDHVVAVAKGLESDLPSGRWAVSMIVGRDTAQLDKSGVARGAIESAAENFSDGVVAPVFWFLLLGLPGIIAYKVVNTADSMIGHRSEKYLQFGWAAARLDDVLNYIPARISALLICAAHGSVKAWEIVLRDASLHRSPNAGWPEAAMAGVLDVALSGPRSYGDKLGDDPYVNYAGVRQTGTAHIRAAVKVIWRAWLLMFVLVLVPAIITLLF